MAPSRKRRAPVEEPEEYEEDEQTILSETQSQHRSKRRNTPTYEEDEGEDNGEDGSSTSRDQMAKSLVRYALACEYSRVPIKRPDVSSKILGAQSRQFQAVFDRAQMHLADVFGMEMVELPNREKVTIRQRRAAQNSESQTKSSKQWVLANVLPERFRNEDIISPPRIPTEEVESAYVGLYTMIISLISLSGGSLPENKLERYLKRTNADQSTPVDKTDKLLARMIKEGYIAKIKEMNAGEEVVDYYVGPRGKAEVGDDAVAGMVKEVYYGSAMEDLDKRVERSLGIAERRPPSSTQMQNRDRDVDGGGDGNIAAPSTQTAARSRPGRPRQRRSSEQDLE